MFLYGLRRDYLPTVNTVQIYFLAWYFFHIALANEQRGYNFIMNNDPPFSFFKYIKIRYIAVLKASS